MADIYITSITRSITSASLSDLLQAAVDSLEFTDGSVVEAGLHHWPNNDPTGRWEFVLTTRGGSR